MARARRHINVFTRPPVKLNLYTLQNDLDPGIYNTWNKSTDDLSNICVAMLEGVRFLHTQKLKNDVSFIQQVPIIKAYVDDFVSKVLLRFDKIHKTNKIPWGKNWYAFVQLISFLAQYLLLEDSINRVQISKIILKIVPDPTQIFKTDRVRYSAQLLGPWLLAYYFLDALDEAVKKEQYIIARKTVLANITHKTHGSGLHVDASWMAYKPLMAAYGTLLESISDMCVYYYYMDKSLRNKQTLKDIWLVVNRILCHQTIPLGRYTTKKS